jgi:signal peptidase I
MSPTLLTGDIIFVAKWPFVISKNYIPKRGDVIVFSTLDKNDSDIPLNFVKRIVAIPGDQVSISKGILKINGQTTSDQLSAPACTSESLPNTNPHSICFKTPPLEDFGPESVPPQAIFVLGDLRTQPNSKKQQGWGIIPISSIKGLALWIGLSVDNSPKSRQLRWDRIMRRIE